MDDFFIGKLVLFSAPSGAGKTTIVRHLLDSVPGLEFSVSATTRERRNEEVNGRDYYFMSVLDFKDKIKNKLFLEWEEVYQDHYYGTLKSEVSRIWAKRKHIILDLDVAGGWSIKKRYKKLALAVFVKPPTLKVLEERLTARATESEINLKKRIEKAKYELTFADKFDVVLVNDDLESTLKKATSLVNNFLKS